jgi:hypothetical protein
MKITSFVNQTKTLGFTHMLKNDSSDRRRFWLQKWKQINFAYTSLIYILLLYLDFFKDPDT